MEKKKAEKAPHNKKFEDALKELEKIAEELENGDIGLDQSIKKYEAGMMLAKFCREKLDEAERKIEILQKGKNGTVEKKSVSVKRNTGEIEDDEDIQGSLL